MGILVQTRGLSKTYGKGENEVQALKECHLCFTEGSFTSIVGRSGSGKSTLMHLLGGLDAPTTGSVEIEGRDIYRLSDSERTIFRRRRGGLCVSVLQPDAGTDRPSEYSSADAVG